MASEGFSFDADIFSDLHKDAYGVRPSARTWDLWESADDTGKQIIWDSLIEDLDREIKSQNDERAIAEFEALVTANLHMGAASRADAIRWIVDTYDHNGDMEYCCFLAGLPYSMAAQLKAALA